MLNRKTSATKRPSATRVRSRPINLGHGNGFGGSHGDAPTPKTRFSLIDRPCSSPRLKSFPAEQIKRPSQDPQESVDTSRRTANAGQGDTQQPGLHDPLVQSFALTNRNVSSASEQQVSRAFCPVNEQQANQSELAIPSPMAAAANERPPHRPHVPHARDQPLHPAGPPRTARQTEVIAADLGEPDQRQHRDPWRIESDAMRPQVPERESDDRYPGFFRRNVLAKGNESHAFPQGQIAGPNVANLCPVMEEKIADSPQPQQIYQRNQPTVPTCYHNEDVLRRRYADANPGIISPQDVATNQQLNWLGTTQGNCQAQQQYYCHQVPNQIPPSPANPAKTPGVEDQRRKEHGTRGALRFTPAMIKDQETLVTTMRQQGMHEEAMRRQFDALLAEQRKQLLYLEQLERGESNDCKPAPQGRRVQRRISKIEEDGKPEWMLHITPPRIPYSVVEKMRNEREVNSQQPRNTGSPGNPGNYVEAPEAIQQFGRQVTQENYGPPSHNCANGNVANQQQICGCNHGGQPQMEYYGYPMQQQQQQHQFQHQESWQSVPKNSRQESHQAQRHQQAEKALEPSSLLKLRLYKEVIRQQKQNNGLQDPETVREALEALKNPANRKGLEYLDNLNARPERPISLNGAQENFVTNGSSAGRYFCQPEKMPSANGLENQRNPNNPSVASIAQRKKSEEYRWPEYPRQKVKSGARDCFNLVAERENGTVAISTSKDYHVSSGIVSQNPTHVQFRPENVGQLNPAIGKPLAALSRTIPLTLAEENRHQCCAGQSQQFYGNPSQASAANSQPRETPQIYLPTGGSDNAGRGYANGNNEIQEMIVSGGLKYFARKPEYNPNSSVPNHCNADPRRYFYAAVPCQ